MINKKLSLFHMCPSRSQKKSTVYTSQFPATRTFGEALERKYEVVLENVITSLYKWGRSD